MSIIKLVWQGHPCLLSGTVDMSKKFHPFVFMVTKREKAKDYTFMFKCIRDALKSFKCITINSFNSVNSFKLKLFMNSTMSRIHYWATMHKQ